MARPFNDEELTDVRQSLLHGGGVSRETVERLLATIDGKESERAKSARETGEIRSGRASLRDTLLGELGDERKKSAKLAEDLEQARVQLAGCSVAALGGIGDDQVAKRGDFGWSASYGDVLSLRRKFEQARDGLQWALGVLDGGGPPPEKRDHTCGSPNAACDGDCVALAHYATEHRKYDKFLTSLFTLPEPEPAQPACG